MQAITTIQKFDKTCFICNELGHRQNKCPFTQRMPKNYESYLDTGISAKDESNIRSAKSDYLINCGINLDDIDANSKDGYAPIYDAMFPEESEPVRRNIIYL